MMKPLLPAAIGAVIEPPFVVMVPRLKLLVAVSGQVPVMVIADSAVHVAVQAPAAEIVAALLALRDCRPVGFAAVPLTAIAPLKVWVPPPGRKRSHPGPTVIVE